jgi:hypothetical protein
MQVTSQVDELPARAQRDSLGLLSSVLASVGRTADADVSASLAQSVVSSLGNVLAAGAGASLRAGASAAGGSGGSGGNAASAESADLIAAADAVHAAAVDLLRSGSVCGEQASLVSSAHLDLAFAKIDPSGLSVPAAQPHVRFGGRGTLRAGRAEHDW